MRLVTEQSARARYTAECAGVRLRWRTSVERSIWACVLFRVGLELISLLTNLNVQCVNKLVSDFTSSSVIRFLVLKFSF